MIVIGLFVSASGVGFLCWLIFTLAVYALPFFAGIMVGLAVYHSGAGVVGAPVVGFAAGAVTLGAYCAVRGLTIAAETAVSFALNGPRPDTVDASLWRTSRDMTAMAAPAAYLTADASEPVPARRWASCEGAITPPAAAWAMRR